MNLARILLMVGCAVLTILVTLAMVNEGPLGTRDPILLAQNPPLEPCYANQDDAAIFLAYKDWADMMRASDTSFSDPIDNIIPEGKHAGQWIKPGCFAIEDEYGRVTVWEIPFDANPVPPFWVPHS